MKKMLIILFAMVTVSSCNKFLDKLPESNATDGDAWTDESAANINVAGCYALTRAALNDAMAHYSYGDFPTDEFSGTTYGGDGRYGEASRLLWNLSVPASNTWDPMMKLRRYDNFYKIIDQVNRCLHFIPGISLAQFTSANPAAARDAFLGEAYFLRAFAYFYMARIWGDVPLVLERTTDAAEAPPYAKAKQADILAQCLKDLALAQKMLSWQNTGSDRVVRASKGAVFALKAHLYAWMGNYQNCLANADSVMNSGYYSYVSRNNSEYLSIYKGQSSEGIFEIAQSAANEGAGNNLNIAFYTLKAPYLATQTGNGWMQLQADLFTTGLFKDANDARLKTAFAFTGTTDPICIKYSNIVYKGPDQTSPLVLNNIIVFRLSDIALLRAEALAAVGRPGDARAQLDEIRQKADLPVSDATDANLFKAVIEERGRELFLEGHRFYDLVRLARQTGTVNFGRLSSGADRLAPGDFTAGKTYWPFDPTLILSNRLLTQTDYWKSRL
jgi:hypothetical protein